MAALFRKLFARKRQPPLVCAVALDDDGHPVGEDPSHIHTDACFLDFQPLAVVELFQSQGCQSCPPAIPGIHEGTANPNLLLLTYNVTIFDHLGWKDTLATSTSDQRQRAYVKRWQRNSLFLPQVVVNGIADGSGGGGRSDVQEIVQRAREAQSSLGWNIYVEANDTEVRIDTDRQEIESHDILLVTYKSEDEKVKISKGPNKGKKLVHRNAVTEIVKIGEWIGGNLTIPLPTPKSSMRPGTEAAVLIQSGSGGPIVAVAKV
jgi:hypothetical protein